MVGIGRNFLQAYFSQSDGMLVPGVLWQQRQLFRSFMQFMIHPIIQFQIFEWVAMIYIIEIELERSVGEILYDFNTENVETKLSES